MRHGVRALELLISGEWDETELGFRDSNVDDYEEDRELRWWLLG